MSAASRLSLTVDDLDSAQRALRETFVSGPRQSEAQFFPVSGVDGRLSGPYQAMLQAPIVGAPLERLGRAIRYEIALDPCLREIAVLTVALLQESAVEWAAHEALARASGVPDATVDSLSSDDPVFENPLHSDVHHFVVELLKRHDVPDPLFERLSEQLGEAGLLELLTTAGYYQVIAHINNTYRLDAEVHEDEK